jgi:hypothetical protein
VKRNEYRVFMGKLEGNRPLGIFRRRWQDNIKMDLGKIQRSGINWIDLVQDTDQWMALVDTVMNLLVP